MKNFLILGLLFLSLVIGCRNSSNNSNGIGSVPPSGLPPTSVMGTYQLNIISGDGQSGPAVLSPNYQGHQFLPIPLGVEVRRNGQLVDGITVRFSGTVLPDGTVLGPLGLGTVITGVQSAAHLVTTGQAFVEAEPYVVGSVLVTCQVEPQFGISNIVTFTVTGY